MIERLALGTGVAGLRGVVQDDDRGRAAQPAGTDAEPPRQRQQRGSKGDQTRTAPNPAH